MTAETSLEEWFKACAPPEEFSEAWFAMLRGYLTSHSYLARHADMIVSAAQGIVSRKGGDAVAAPVSEAS